MIPVIFMKMLPEMTGIMKAGVAGPITSTLATNS